MNIGEKFYCSRCMREIDDDGIICLLCKYDPAAKHTPWALEEGTLLQNGRYQLGAVIGSGGFGITYAAWDLSLNHPVAVKEYYPANLCERDASEDDSVIINPGREMIYQSGLLRFIREARILGTLQNLKNVVPVLEWFESNNTAYIVMKYISGVTLEEYVRTNHIPPQKVIAMMRDIVDALVLVHAQGIIHRDISPSNIMVQDDGTLILIDFGAASDEERMAQGQEHTVIYNRRYAPIEQYDEASVQGPFTDVYALSATLYHLVCGERPKESVARKDGEALKSPRERHIPIKKYQDKAIMNGLILQPEKRTQSMAEFRSMLYDLPMPEEVIRRRRFMFRAVSAAAAISAAVILSVINLTLGFPLGEGLMYSLGSEGLRVRSITSEREKISVPESVAGIDVVQIDDAAFQGSETLREAYIPGTVRTIGRFAFNGCTNLETVTLGEGVSRISAQAFGGCSKLQAVITPATLTEIDPEAFSNHGERLVLLGSLDSQAADLADRLGLNYAHVETTDNERGITLTKYETKQSNAVVPDYLDGRPVTVLDSGNDEPVFPQTVQRIILPHSLDKIGDYALSEVAVRSIDLPASLTHIGRMAFSQSFVQRVSLPDSVQFVGDEAFSVCLQLRSVKLSSAMKEIPRQCFVRCALLNSVEIPDGISAIRDQAFQRCTSLTSMTLPESVNFVGLSVFEDCTALESIYLPPALNRMDISALDGCKNSLTLVGYKGSFANYLSSKYGFRFYDLRKTDPNIEIGPSGNLWLRGSIASSDTIVLPSYSAYFGAVPARYVAELNGLRSRNVILPEHTESIRTKAFSGNLAVESVDCPPSLRTIDVIAFLGCENLRAVNLKEGLEKIDIQAFKDCGKLSDIVLPSSVKTIGENAFENCQSLTAVKIPASMTLLDRRTFAGTGIVSLDVPGNIVKCSKTFENCRSLRSVVFSEGIRTIEGSFAGCTALESVIIPAGVNKISRSTFRGCVRLRDVWIYSDNAELDYISDNARMDGYLLSDSPAVTIHARRGSSAHIYASLRGIRFEEIPAKSDEVRAARETVRFRASKRVYSDEQLIAMITPKPNDEKYHYWWQFMYALGYGFSELAYKCLDAYEAAGNDDDKVFVSAARLFLAQAGEHGYTAGQAIGFFEGRREHPEFRIGDIMVAVNGQTFRTEEEFEILDKPSEAGYKVYTVLRADESGVLRKIDLTVRKGSPMCATMAIIPRTFEDL